MWLYAGLIILGVVLGIAALLIFIRLDLRGRHHRTGSQRRRAAASPNPHDLSEMAGTFLDATLNTFGSQEEALKPAAWVNPAGKNFIPKAVKESHAAFKVALKAAGKSRTPSGARLVETALKIVQDHKGNDSREPGAESPKITFAQGEGTQIP